jgi:hypothetical protein
MKKSTTIVLVLMILCFLIAAGYNLISKDSGDIAQPEKTDQDQAKETIRTSIKNLMAENQSVKCIAAMGLDNGGKMTGTVYIANGKMRNDAEIESVEGKKSQLHTIIDQEWFYSWSTELPDGGIKMKISEIEDMSIPEDQGGSSGEVKNLNQEFNFRCNEWTSVDNSEFIPPSEINFEDFAQRIEDLQNTTQGD